MELENIKLKTPQNTQKQPQQLLRTFFKYYTTDTDSETSYPFFFSFELYPKMSVEIQSHVNFKVKVQGF